MLNKIKKINKGSPYFAPIIVFIIAVSVNIGFNIYRNYQTETTPETQQTQQTQQDNKNSNKKDDAKEPLVDFHVGISNIVVFGGLTIALIIVKNKDKLSSLKQKEISYKEDKKE
jgi:predicted negative regulator of RcsB-dependent stress response